MDGTERQVLKDLKVRFDSPQPSTPSPIMITGVIDQFDMYGVRFPGQRRSFEVYGNFPGVHEGNVDVPGWEGNYVARAGFFGGGVSTVTTYGETMHQLNIALVPWNADVKWCLLRVQRKDGVRSNDFGPIRLNRIPPPSGDCAQQVTQRYWDHWGS